MSKLDDLIQKLCPNGVEYRHIGDMAKISRGKVMSKNSLQENFGEYPVYSSQTENDGKLGSITTYMYDGEYLTWTTDGANAGTVFFRSGKFSVTNVCGVIDFTSKDVDIKYIYYVLNREAPQYVNSGMGNPKLMSNVMARIRIPVPPLEVQREIVRMLDSFTLLTAELTAELTARKKQYEFYRDNLLSTKRNIPIVKLKDVLDGFYRGLEVKNVEEMKNEIPCVHYEEISKQYTTALYKLEVICAKLNIDYPAEMEARQKQYEFYHDALSEYVATGNIIAKDRNIIKLIQCVFGSIWLKIGDVAEVFRGEYITKKGTTAGDIPVILGGQEPAYYIDKANHTGEIVVVARSGASAGYVSYWNEPIFVTDGFGYEAKEWLVTTKYLYYVMKNMEKQLNEMKRGAGVPHISGEAVLNITISVPTLEKQQELVKIIDKFDTLCNDLSAGLPAEIEARRKQYEYYRDKLLSFQEMAK